MPTAVHKMGGDNVLTNTLGVLFSDGTQQETAALPLSSGGSTSSLGASGFSVVDVFGNTIQTGVGTPGAMYLYNASGAFIGIDETSAGITDAEDDGLQCGSNGQNYNLSNSNESSGIWNIISGQPGTWLVDTATLYVGIKASGVPEDQNIVMGSSLAFTVAGTVVSGPLTFGGVAMPSVAPTIGQVMTATSATAAAWQTPSGGGATQRQLVSAGTIGSALISLPITITWGTAFADNNYAVSANVEIGEPTSDGAVTSIICIASIQKKASGVGVIVTVANADSIPHSCTINISATHL